MLRKASFILTTLALILCISFGVQAGWFGPSNYEECILIKMKGQDRSMFRFAKDACEQEFPHEKELFEYLDKIDYSWQNNGNDIYLKIKKNLGKYRITKYKASFSKKSCDNIKVTSDYSVTKTFLFNKYIKISPVSVENANEYKCMRTIKIWGMRKK